MGENNNRAPINHFYFKSPRAQVTARFEYRHTLLHILHTLNWKVCFKSKNEIADSNPICAFMNLK